MKKVLTVLLLVVGLSSYGQTHQNVPKRQSFFTVPGTYVALSNNFALQYGSATNTSWVPYSIGTNVIGGATNSVAGIGTFYPQILGDVNVRCDGNGAPAYGSFTVTWNVATNYVSSQGGVAGKFPNEQQNWPIVPNFTNAAGGQGIPISLIPAALGSTNTTTVIIARSVDGVNFGTTAQDQFIFSFGSTAATITAGGVATLTTNIPQSFAWGVVKYRCLAMTNNSVAGAIGTTINSLGYNEWSE